MTRTRHAITLLTLWLAMLFAGPVLPAFGVSCSDAAVISAPAACPMAQGAANKAAAPKKSRPCCCCSSRGAPKYEAAPVSASVTSSDTCACSLRPGVPTASPESLPVPLPTLSIALSDAPTIEVIPPLAYVAADAPLPPFPARLQIPLRSVPTGRAPPVA